MKQLAIIFGFFLISFNGFCDTLDFWHVYLNDELVAKFNLTSKDCKINLKKSELKSSDMITIKYYTDSPCVDCKETLYVYTKENDEKKMMTPVTTIKNYSGDFSIPLNNLLDIERTVGINTFQCKIIEWIPNLGNAITMDIVALVLI